MTDSLLDQIQQRIEEIDELLSMNGVDLRDKPMAAARFFVDELIIEIKGDTKEDYLEKPWFAEIYQTIKNWYQNRFGERLNSNTEKTTLGLVFFYSAMFILEIPRVLEVPGDEPMTKWISFPDSVQREEKPLNWIKHPPNYINMPANDRNMFKDETIWMANINRSIHRDFVTANLSEDYQISIAHSIPVHLSIGAKYVVGNSANINISIWQWHLAVEKALKLYIYQKNSKPSPTHDLKLLISEANQRGLNYKSDILTLIPNKDDAIGYRYGEGKELSEDHIYKHYKDYLRICNSCSKALDRNMGARKARFLIQVPPWERPIKQQPN